LLTRQLLLTVLFITSYGYVVKSIPKLNQMGSILIRKRWESLASTQPKLSRRRTL